MNDTTTPRTLEKANQLRHEALVKGTDWRIIVDKALQHGYRLETELTEARANLRRVVEIAVRIAEEWVSPDIYTEAPRVHNFKRTDRRNQSNPTRNQMSDTTTRCPVVKESLTTDDTTTRCHCILPDECPMCMESDLDSDQFRDATKMVEDEYCEASYKLTLATIRAEKAEARVNHYCDLINKADDKVLELEAEVTRLQKLLSLEEEGHEQTKKLCVKFLDTLREHGLTEYGN